MPSTVLLSSETTLLTLAALLVVLGILAFVRRRLDPQQKNAWRAQSVGLTRQHALHVVDLDHQRLLIGTGPSGSPCLLCQWNREPASVCLARDSDGDGSRHGG